MALAFHVGPVAATLLGMLTGIGGGMVRDVLVREIPTVLRTELYAVAALIGAAVVVIGRMLDVPSGAAAGIGAVLCFGLRFMAIRRDWQLPIARPLKQSETDVNRSDGLAQEIRKLSLWSEVSRGYTLLGAVTWARGELVKHNPSTSGRGRVWSRARLALETWRVGIRGTFRSQYRD
jgi:hypothetical protein